MKMEARKKAMKNKTKLYVEKMLVGNTWMALGDLNMVVGDVYYICS